MLENMLKPDWLERNPRFAFLIGFVYSIIGIVAAYIVFPRSQGIASIAFTSMLLIPSLTAILSIEEKQDSVSKKFSIKKIFKDHNDVLQVYLLLFLGIFFAFALFSIKFDNLLVHGVFDSQLRVIGVDARSAADAVGNASGTGLNFFSILFNNLKVILIFLVLSLIFGAGSIMFLTWNASVWGVVFAYVALNSNNAFDNFSLIFLKVMPHMFLEVGAYFFAIVAGGIMSQGVLREKLGSKKFDYVMKDGLSFLTIGIAVLIFAAFVEVYVYPLF